MQSLPEIEEARNVLNRVLVRETPMRPTVQSPAEPGWQLAYIARRGTLITLWVLHPDNLDRRLAMLEHDCEFGKARDPIDLSDSEWDSLVLGEAQEVRS